jgi:hypothetical protein
MTWGVPKDVSTSPYDRMMPEGFVCCSLMFALEARALAKSRMRKMCAEILHKAQEHIDFPIDNHVAFALSYTSLTSL